MVRYGFSLSDLRNLYIDELYAFFEELIFILEKEGVMQKGATDKLKGTSTVDQLRKQLRGLKLR
jgi:hypothetical protein